MKSVWESLFGSKSETKFESFGSVFEAVYIECPCGAVFRADHGANVSEASKKHHDHGMEMKRE